MLAVACTFLAACGDDGRDSILGIDDNVALPPTVTVVAPANNSTDVAVNSTVITAQFSEAVDPITAANFILVCSSPCSSPTGTVAMNAANTVATYTVANPTELDELTLYTATITSATSVRTNLSLAQPFEWQFTTAEALDTTRPQVTSTKPLTASPEPASNVPVNTTVSAVFNEDMLASTITSSNFTVTCAAPCVSPIGTVSYDSSTHSATFTADENLEFEATYTATITSSVTDLAGNQLAGNQGSADTESDYTWQFVTGTTVDTTRPRVTITVPTTTNPGPTDEVPVNTGITAVFSEDMLATTINENSFTVTCEEPCISPVGTVNYVVASRSAVFSPEDNLEEDVTYTATIEQTVTDVAGNLLAGNQAPATNASDYIWAFTTVAPIPADNISVQSTEPMYNGMIAVCPSASINATFEIPSGTRLDPNTVNHSTFIIFEDADPANTIVADSIQLDLDTGTIATFTPQNQLAENITYRATIKSGANGVKDLMIPGNEMVEDYVWIFTTEPPTESCLEPANLRTVEPFGSFGGISGITNQGLLTVINGDLGTIAASTLITGFVSEPGCEYTITTLNEGKVNGKIYTAPPPPTVACPQDGTAVTEAIAIQARLDAEAAYLSLTPANMPGGQNPGNENLGNLTLAPGIYTAQSGAFSIQGGDLTLDAQGNQNAVWVFQMATTLTVGGPGADFPQSVILVNGAQAKNIFWQVGSAATINAAGGGTMKGTIIAQEGVSISTSGNVNIVTLDGRALSLGASVTMVNTVVNVPAE